MTATDLQSRFDSFKAGKNLKSMKYFVQTHHVSAPFFEEEEFDTLEAAESFAAKQNAFYSVEGGGDGALYCEVVLRSA